MTKQSNPSDAQGGYSSAKCKTSSDDHESNEDVDSISIASNTSEKTKRVSNVHVSVLVVSSRIKSSEMVQ